MMQRRDGSREEGCVIPFQLISIAGWRSKKINVLLEHKRMMWRDTKNLAAPKHEGAAVPAQDTFRHLDVTAFLVAHAV